LLLSLARGVRRARDIAINDLETKTREALQRAIRYPRFSGLEDLITITPNDFHRSSPDFGAHQSKFTDARRIAILAFLTREGFQPAFVQGKIEERIVVSVEDVLHDAESAERSSKRAKTATESTSSTAATASDAADAAAAPPRHGSYGLCIVCHTNEAILLFGCGHVCVCRDCVDRTRDHCNSCAALYVADGQAPRFCPSCGYKCPLCRATSDKYIRAYFP
jgi:hypothetical protein